MREKWMPVLQLYSFDSNWNIVKKYEFQEGKYYVSDAGRFKRDGKIVQIKPDSVGTYTVQLDRHRFKLHQIVLQTFMPEGIVNGCSPDHIDRERRWDNSLGNLRWANKYLQAYNRDNKEYKYKTVYCPETGVVYKSCQDAEKTLGIAHNMVCRVARGERKSVHGYHFSYVFPATKEE